MKSHVNVLPIPKDHPLPLINLSLLSLLVAVDSSTKHTNVTSYPLSDPFAERFGSRSKRDKVAKYCETENRFETSQPAKLKHILNATRGSGSNEPMPTYSWTSHSLDTYVMTTKPMTDIPVNSPILPRVTELPAGESISFVQPLGVARKVA